MSTPNQPETSPAVGEEINVTPGLEEKLQQFWLRNRRGLMLLGVVVLVAIIAKGAWEYLAVQKELDIGRSYAAAKTTEQLRTFAQDQGGHELAGVAWLQVADANYAAGNYSEAVSAYQESRKTLSTGPLADRGALGLAMAQLQAGNTAEGQAALKQLVDATGIAKGVQVEAAYHLASFAQVNGKADEVKQYVDRIMQIDPASAWAQRAMTLRMGVPTVAESGATQPAPADEAASGDPVIKLNLGN